MAVLSDGPGAGRDFGRNAPRLDGQQRGMKMPPAMSHMPQSSQYRQDAARQAASSQRDAKWQAPEFVRQAAARYAQSPKAAPLPEGDAQLELPLGPVGALTQRMGAAGRYAGAALSVALIAGVGLWGYQLLMRDVNGIPVVRAMEGPMRISPDNPGGAITGNAGLAVNAIAAIGAAAPPEDVLILAPASGSLAAEDLEVTMAPVADPVVPDAATAAAPVSNVDDILALADQISAGIDPMGAAPAGTDAPVALSVEGVTVEAGATEADGGAAATAPSVAIIPRDVPGVATALRPPVRPAGVAADVAAAVAAAIPTSTAAAGDPAALITTDIAPGTVMVQFGAFETPEIAGEAWTRLNSRFAEFMGGKTRVIQQANSGGRDFYRLRAAGFTDMADARRFCAALLAENAECIPAT